MGFINRHGMFYNVPGLFFIVKFSLYTIIFIKSIVFYENFV